MLVVNEKEVTGDSEYKNKMPINQKSYVKFNAFYQNCKDKKKISNVLFARSSIVSGEGIAVVCAVGRYT